MGLFYSRGRKCLIWASEGDFLRHRAAGRPNPLNPCETAFKRLSKAPSRGDPGRFGGPASGTGTAHLQATRPTWRIAKEKQAHELPRACRAGLAKWDPILRRRVPRLSGIALRAHEGHLKPSCTNIS